MIVDGITAQSVDGAGFLTGGVYSKYHQVGPAQYVGDVTPGVK